MEYSDGDETEISGFVGRILEQRGGLFFNYEMDTATAAGA